MKTAKDFSEWVGLVVGGQAAADCASQAEANGVPDEKWWSRVPWVYAAADLLLKDGGGGGTLWMTAERQRAAWGETRNEFYDRLEMVCLHVPGEVAALRDKLTVGGEGEPVAATVVRDGPWVALHLKW